MEEFQKQLLNFQFPSILDNKENNQVIQLLPISEDDDLISSIILKGTIFFDEEAVGDTMQHIFKDSNSSSPNNNNSHQLGISNFMQQLNM
ncbi:hypothetical protein CsatA_018842 [Cannabis sativa]